MSLEETLSVEVAGRYAGFQGLSEAQHDLHRLGESFEKLKRQHLSLGSAFRAGTTAGMGIGAGSIGFATVMLKAAQQNAQAEATLQATHAVSKRRMADFVRFTDANATKLLQQQSAMYQGIGAAMTGAFGPDATKRLTVGAAKMTAIFGGEMASNTNTLVGILKAFHTQSSQIPARLDAITVAARKSGQGINFLSGSAGKMLLQAQAAGASFGESLALAADVSRLGVGGRGVAAFGGVVQRLGTLQTQPGFGRLVNVGQYGIVGSLQNLFNAPNATPALLQKLLGGGIGYTLAQRIAQQGAPGLGPTAGALGGQFNQYSKTEAGRLKQFQLSLDDLQETMGKALLPALVQILKALTPIIQQFGSWAQKNPKTIRDLTELGVKIGGVSFALRALLPFLEALKFGKAVTDAAKLTTALSGEAGLAASLSTVAKSGAATEIEAAGLAAATAAPRIALMSAALETAVPLLLGLLALQNLSKGPPKRTRQSLSDPASPFWLPPNIRKQYLQQHPSNVPAGSQTRGTANWGGGQRSASWGAGLRSVYSGPNWTLGKSLGDTSGVPSGFGGRWFGSHFGAVTSNAPSGYQQWWAQNVFGNAAIAGRIGDTDFGATDQRAGHVYELPGSTKRKWTFVRYLPDPSNPGQDIAVWRDPMGTIQAFNHTDPRGLRTSYGGWRQLRPGMVGYGGQAAGVSMESHVCIVTSPDGRQDLMILTGQGEMQMRAAGKKVQRLPGAGAGAGLVSALATPWERSNAGLLTSMAKQNRVPIGALQAILSLESSGGMNPLAGANVMQVTPIAAQQIGFTGPYATNRRASVQAGAAYFSYLLHGPAHGDLRTAFRMYNGSGRDAEKYATRAMAMMGGTNRAGGGNLPNIPTGTGAPTTPAGWEALYSGRVSNIQQTITEAQFRTQHPGRMPAARQQEYRHLLNRLAKQTYEEERSHIMATTGPGDIRNGLLKDALTRFHKRQGNLFKWAAGGADQAHGPAYWATYWGNLASNKAQNIANVFGDQPVPANMRPWVRNLYRSNLSQESSDLYRAAVANIMATVPPGSAREQQLRLLNFGPRGFQWRQHHLFQWAAGRSPTGNAIIDAAHVVGHQWCTAERENRQSHKKTAHNTGQTVDELKHIGHNIKRAADALTGTGGSRRHQNPHERFRLGRDGGVPQLVRI
jgi:hypothetical protein